MSAKSDQTFKRTKEIYISWIEETYGITQKDIEIEFLNTKVRGNSVLTDDEANLVCKKLGLFGRSYTSITKLAEELGTSRSKTSNIINSAYLKISIKKQTSQIGK